MRQLRYSINVTLDWVLRSSGGVPDEELHRHATETLRQADALLLGRVTCQMMEADYCGSRISDFGLRNGARGKRCDMAEAHRVSGGRREATLRAG